MTGKRYVCRSVVIESGQEQGSCPLRLPALTALWFVLPTLRRLVSALFRSGLFLFLPDAFPVLMGARLWLGALFIRLLIRVRTLIVHAVSPSRCRMGRRTCRCADDV